MAFNSGQDEPGGILFPFYAAGLIKY